MKVIKQIIKGKEHNLMVSGNEEEITDKPKRILSEEETKRKEEIEKIWNEFSAIKSCMTARCGDIEDYEYTLTSLEEARLKRKEAITAAKKFKSYVGPGGDFWQTEEEKEKPIFDKNNQF